jgi:hypothetical protein
MRALSRLIGFVVFGFSLLGGCARPPVPAGPGAASATDLRPWLQDAPTVTYTGRLQYFHCTSENGNYLTWSLDPAGKEDAAEVDVRACADEAWRFEDRRVTITGKLLYREPRHFPLLVAEKIVSGEPAGTAAVPVDR